MKSPATQTRQHGASALKVLMSKPARSLASLCALALLSACSGFGGSAGPHYRCEHNIEFNVKFVDDTAILSGTGGHDVLYRDAGGQGERQTVYSNPRMRAEFGLGSSGKEAILRYPLLPLAARCALD